MTITIVSLLILSGMAAGLMAGMFGIGGGLIVVPILFFIFQLINVSTELAMPLATATSLACIVPTAVASIRAHYLHGNIDLERLTLWAPFVALSAASCAWFAQSIKGPWITLLFALVLLFVALKFLLPSRGYGKRPAFSHPMLQAFSAAVTGGVSVVIGIGGGTLGVPLLAAQGLAIHRAIGTASVFGLLIALPGVLVIGSVAVTPLEAPPGTWRLFYVPGIAIIVPLSVAFAPLGVRLAGRCNGALLRRGFGVFLLMISLRMLFIGIS